MPNQSNREEKNDMEFFGILFLLSLACGLSVGVEK